MKPKQRQTIVIVAGGLLVAGCLLAGFTVLGSGAGLWWLFNSNAETVTPVPRVTRRAAAPTFTPTASPTTLPTATSTPTVTPTSPPTATPFPTNTPALNYPFVIAETAQFPTSHLNFDIYVAITDTDNRPLSGYRLLGRHSGGLQIESQVSAGDWTVNSGAKHYKAGNIKYEAPNSPTGVWTLQLVDEAGAPVAPPVEFPFDTANPTWYFLLYRLVE